MKRFLSEKEKEMLNYLFNYLDLLNRMEPGWEVNESVYGVLRKINEVLDIEDDFSRSKKMKTS